MADKRQPHALKPDEQDCSVECEDKPSGDEVPSVHPSGRSSSASSASFHTAPSSAKQDTELNDRRSETNPSNATQGVNTSAHGQNLYVPPHKRNAGSTGKASSSSAITSHAGNSHALTSNPPAPGDNRPAATRFHGERGQKPLREPRGPPAGDLSEEKVRLEHKKLGFEQSEHQARLQNSADKSQLSKEQVEQQRSVLEDLARHRREEEDDKDGERM